MLLTSPSHSHSTKHCLPHCPQLDLFLSPLSPPSKRPVPRPNIQHWYRVNQGPHGCRRQLSTIPPRATGPIIPPSLFPGRPISCPIKCHSAVFVRNLFPLCLPAWPTPILSALNCSYANYVIRYHTAHDSQDYMGRDWVPCRAYCSR